MTPVPGRMQVIDAGSPYPRVIVDYAHTPDALEKTLAALRPQCRGELICLVGCGGDRDRGKRGQMGLAAVKGSDRVWFTSDNPRSEDPSAIIHDMLEPLKNPDSSRVYRQPSFKAIAEAIESAGADDILLFAGMSREPMVSSAFSDFAIVDQLQSGKN